MNKKSIIIPIQAAFLCLATLAAYPQEKSKPIRFGKIEPADFGTLQQEKDTSAHAIILSDIGEAEYDVERDHFVVIYKRHRRVKIIDENGYDAATASITLYNGGGNNEEEKLNNLKASTYILDNGKVIETKLDSKNIFTEKVDEHFTRKKFTAPALKPGAIFEYTYTTTSPYFNDIPTWYFQDSYPTVWSEFTVTIPECYNFVYIGQGYIKYEKNRETTPGRRTYNLAVEEYGATAAATHGTWDAATTTSHWVAKDVPALKEESYTTTLNNHIAKIEFQLSYIKYPDAPVKPYMDTWPKVYEKLNELESFGANLSKNNSFLGDEVDALTKGLKDDTAKARRIYEYVRNNFTCSDHDGLLMSKSLKTVFTTHNGNESDINLLMVAMLRKAGLDAYPVMLSTRRHGIANQVYPLISRFNYVVASVNATSGTYFMDASYSYLGFGRLDASAYNGYARIISPDMTAVSFYADSLMEQKSTFVMMSADSAGNITGSFQQRPTYFESCQIRNTVKDKGKDGYFKPLSKYFSSDAEITDANIDDEGDNETPLKLSYNFSFKSDDANILYINPMFYEATKSNPFKSAERFYPVEMPCVSDELFTLNLTIPDGYVVDELPKSTMVKLNETDGMFQYLIQQSDNMIQFRCRVKLNRATFDPDEYTSLRQFFDLIVKKQSEQIVLKRKA
jgi:hypothetical protein